MTVPQPAFKSWTAIKSNAMTTPKPTWTLDDVGQLKKLTPKIATHVSVLGYHTPNDGGGGIFDWDFKSKEVEDHGTVFTQVLKPKLGRWKRRFQGPLNVKWFGAYGDWNPKTASGHDDFDALTFAAKAMNRTKSGTLTFPPGTYRINRHTTKTAIGSGLDDIVYEDCSGLTLVGHRATIDVKGDIRRTKPDIRAVQPFVFKNCSKVRIQGFELNGNVDKMWRPDGVAGFDQAGSGIVFGFGSSHYTIADCYVHHFPTDGIYLGWSDPKGRPATPAKADTTVELSNVVSKFNARNGLSLISVRGGRFQFCDFSENGRAEGEYGAVASMVGIDIEPSFAATPTTGEFDFQNCTSIDNAGAGLSVTRADLCTFSDCLFWGTGYYSVVVRAPQTTFIRCKIYGECVNYEADVNGLTRYTGCSFEDRDYETVSLKHDAYRSYGCISTGNAAVELDYCNVTANNTKALAIGTQSVQSKITHATVTHRWSACPPNDQAHSFQSLILNCVLETIEFREDLNGAGPWYINARDVTLVGQVLVDGPKVHWQGLTGPIGLISS